MLTPSDYLHNIQPTKLRLTRGQKQRSLIVALPIMACLTVPLVQLFDIVYLYDILILIAIGKLGIPKITHSQARQILRPVFILILAVLVGCGSALVRTDGGLRPIQYSIQYLLALIFFISLYSNIVLGRVDIQIIVHWVIRATISLAAFAILQYALMIVNRPVGEQLYTDYLRLSGYSERFFETRYLALVDASGIVRAMGTWDVATTFGGIMALSITWLLLIRESNFFKLSVFFFGGIAILASSSRHAWIISVVILFGLIPGSLKKRLTITGLGLFLIIGAIILGSSSDQSSNTLSLADQVISRYERTSDQGLEDSSLQLRYVEGTSRFINYSLQDPSMLIVGFGIGTEKALIDSLGIDRFLRMDNTNHQFGFVSNSWLLIWRNMGLLGFVGLVSLFMSIWRIGKPDVLLPLMITGLIILADNYAIHSVRCFFLILAFLAVIAGKSVLQAQGNLLSKKPLI